MSYSAFGRLFLSKTSFEMTTLPFKITQIPGTGLTQYFGCSVPKKKKKKQKTKVVRCARCEQCSAEAQTTRSRAIEPGPSSPTPEKRQTPRAANGHRVPNPKHLLQLTLMRCIPTFIHRRVYILRTYYCLLHTRFLFCN